MHTIAGFIWRHSFFGGGKPKERYLIVKTCKLNNNNNKKLY